MAWSKSSDVNQKLVGLTKKDIEIVEEFRSGKEEGFSNALRRMIRNFHDFKKMNEILDQLSSLELTLETMMEPEAIKSILKSEMEVEEGKSMSWKEVKEKL